MKANKHLLVGSKINKLNILSYDKKSKKYYCLCDCGSYKWINANHVNGKNKYKNIYKIRSGKYVVKVKRNNCIRESLYISNENDAIKLRNEWIKEWQENSEKWIKNTLKNNYKRYVQSLK